MSVALRGARAPGLGRVHKSAALLAGAALIGAVSASSDAQAQCVNSNFSFSATASTLTGTRNVIPTASPLVSITNTVNTAFLTNTTSFVSAPGNAQPGQNSGGVWARSIAGYTDYQAKSSLAVSPGITLIPAPGGIIGGAAAVDGSGGGYFVNGGELTGSQKCKQSNHQDYAGVQVGADLAKLNIGGSGANLHFGITAGYLGAWAQDTTPSGGSYADQPGDMKSQFEVPFLGVYTTFTQGNFFADGQVRWDFYQSNSSSVIQGFSGVENEARGISVTGNVGYRIALPGTWFVEPSVGASWSRVSSDPVTFVDHKIFQVGGTVKVDDFESMLGRATLRVGANVTQGIYTWQPFASISAIHEFAGDVTSQVSLIHFGALERSTLQRLDRTLRDVRPVWARHGDRGGQHGLARLRAWRHQVRRERPRRRLQRRPALSVVIGESVAAKSVAPQTRHSLNLRGSRQVRAPRRRDNETRQTAAASARSISAARSVTASRPTESRSMPSVMPSSARASGLSRWCVVVAGWVIRLLASPRLLEMRISLQCVEEAEGRRLAAGDLEGHDLAEPRHLLARQRRLRVVGAAAIERAGDAGLAGQMIGDLGGGLALRAHAHGQRLQAL